MVVADEQRGSVALSRASISNSPLQRDATPASRLRVPELARWVSYRNIFSRSMIINSRALAIQRVKDRLVRDSFPRIQMALLVAVTGGFGLLASFTMLQFGMESMALRYPLALAFAYVFFLFLIWLWLRTKAEDYLDVPDIPDLIPRPCNPGSLSDFKSGGGGNFGGGGSSGAFDGSAVPFEGAGSSPLRAVGEAVGSAADADEFAIPLVAIALAIGIAIASLYVVYIAPVLFAEVLVDGALSYVLFRHLRGQDPQHWLFSAFRRTVLPFAATAVFLAAAGAAMAAYAPGAKSVGQVMKHANTQRTAK